MLRVIETKPKILEKDDQMKGAQGKGVRCGSQGRVSLTEDDTFPI